MSFVIRDYTPDDDASLAARMHAAVHAGGARDYTSAQLAAWSPEPMSAEAFTAAMSEDRRVWVAEDSDGTARGFIELEDDGHIDRFYCHPVGAGIGSALYDRLKAEADARGMPRLRVEASEPARRFFLRAGFCVESRREVWRNGVCLHNYAMTRTLR